MSEFRRRLMMVGGGSNIPNYLCFTALEDGTFTLDVGAGINTFRWVEYSLDMCQTWVHTDKTSGVALTVTTPTVLANNKVFWRADYNDGVFNQTFTFSSTGMFNVSGDVESIHTYNDFENISIINRNYTALSLFQNCSHLISAENLILKNVASNRQWCYRAMFEGCTSLTTPPALSLVENAYTHTFAYMFHNCTSMTSAPSLSHIQIIGTEVFRNMFDGCTSLTTAPQMPSQSTMTAGSCDSMFSGCTSLTTAPELPATTLAGGCYRGMFKGCSSLRVAPELPALTLANNCYLQMFYKSGIIESPILAAPILVANCYEQMFRECPNINKITMLATDITASNCLHFFALWIGQNSGTFVKNAQTTIPYGNDGVPNGWTIVDYQE